MPAGVMSHTSQNLIKKTWGRKQKDRPHVFLIPMFHFCSRGVSPPFASTVRRLVARDIAV